MRKQRTTLICQVLMLLAVFGLLLNNGAASH